MHRKMLGACRRLHKPVLLLLQPFHKPHAHPGGQIRVLPIGLLPPAPAGVPENIHIGRPESKPLIDIPVSCFFLRVILRPGLLPDDFRHFPVQILVKGGGNADCLRKYRGRPSPCNAVQRLIPPVIGRDSQPLDCRRIVKSLAYLFLQCHLCHQRGGSFSIIAHIGFLSFVEFIINIHFSF